MAVPVGTVTAWTGVGNAANTVLITELAGVSTTNYPVQLGRPFAQGEIAAYPQVVVDDVPVTTQADVKTRWPDGSVKHAILSFLIPALDAHAVVTVQFRNQATGNNAGYLDEAGMLDAAYDFEATLAVTNGSTSTVSARTMLDAGHFTYWLQGPVCTSIILADHTATRTYDVGFDSYKPFRPIIHATFWPAIHKVRVRFIGELANTEEFEDVTASIALTTGSASPASVYTKTSTVMYAGSRWTRGPYWIGGTPTSIGINHNLAYLADTQLVPNYDTTKVVPEATMASLYASWTSVAKDLYDKGLLTNKLQGSAGEAEELGPFDARSVRWLYSGDARMEEIACKNADLEAACGYHFREGDATKYFDRESTVPGLGRVMSVRHRPTLFIGEQLDYLDTVSEPYYNVPGEGVDIVGTRTTGGWASTIDHSYGNVFYCPYLLTGDFWYLEELQFWNAWNLAASNPVSWSGRGPTGAWCAIGGGSQGRSEAWSLRDRCYAAVLTPDDTPEKTYFTESVQEAIAALEGCRGLTPETPYEGNLLTLYNWAATPNNGRNPRYIAFQHTGATGPYHTWSEGSHAEANGPDYEPSADYIDISKAYAGVSVFMNAYMCMVLGIAKRLGFQTGALLNYLGPFFVAVANSSKPEMCATFHFPTLTLDYSYFASIEDAIDAFVPTYDPAVGFAASLTNAQHGYYFIVGAAVAQCSGVANFATAQAWMNTNVWSDPQDVLNANPKWCLVPEG